MPTPRRIHRSTTPARATSLLLMLLPLTAQTHAAADEAEHLGDLPVVLSATRLSLAPADAPGAVTVIDRAMIRASGARDIHELFRLVPGFQLGMHTGNHPLVTYHGLSDDAPRRMLLQVDGRSVYSPYLISGVEWNQIGVDIDDIERIEVFRGSNSAAYGSNAFLGVANIITRSTSETLGTAVRYRAGDGGVNDVGVRVGKQLGDVALRLRASRNYDHGFAEINDWRKSELATLNADWRMDSDNTLDFQAGWTNTDSGIGKEDNPTDPERTSRISTSFGLLRWRHAPAPDEELTLTYYHQEEDGRDVFDLVVPIPPSASRLPVTLNIPFHFNYNFKALRDDLEIQRITSLAPSLRAVIGAGVRVDRITAPIRFNSGESVRNAVNHAFGTLEWRASPRWLFNVGAMIEDNSLTGSSLAPRASANYSVSDTQTWRLSVNRSNRNPTAFEQKSNMIFSNSAAFSTPRGTIPAGTAISQTFRPSPGLQAERITTYELGYLAHLQPLNTTLDARLFLERARDLIEINLERSSAGLIPRSNTRYLDNTGKADIRGLEVAATWRPGLNTWLTLQHTELRIDGPSISAAEAARRPSEWVEYTAPRHSSTIFGAWEFHPRWQLSVAKHWIGSMSWYQDAEHRTTMYRQLDLRLAHRLPPSVGRGEIAVSARNIDGHEQSYAPGTSWWGSRIFGSLSLEL